jgi:lysophospholipase L1-like esterase
MRTGLFPGLTGTLMRDKAHVLSMKNKLMLLLLSTLAAALCTPVSAQTKSETNAPAAVAAYTNSAIVPAPRPDERSHARTELVLQRAKDNPGPCDVIFIGDSITHAWDTVGKNVWNKYYGDRKALNFGVGGDRTQHVLWRFEHGQLDGLKPKVSVVMIGTNNSNRDDNSEAEILEGVTAVVNQIRQRLPETKVLLLGIFPRSKTFSAQRGKILQVNQALEKLADNKSVYYLDFGSQMIEADGSISTGMMGDALHPGERGYELWAAAIEPKLKELLAQ